MILIDYSQLIIANAFYANQSQLNEYYPTEGLVLQHMVFNKLRELKQDFNDCGEVIICCDSDSYWRRDFFAGYKIKRKAIKEKDAPFWEMVSTQKIIIEEILREVFPYKVIKTVGAEADDIIACLVRRFPDDKHAIISSDGDFVQLLKYSDVRIYSPIQNTMHIKA